MVNTIAEVEVNKKRRFYAVVKIQETNINRVIQVALGAPRVIVSKESTLAWGQVIGVIVCYYY